MNLGNWVMLDSQDRWMQWTLIRKTITSPYNNYCALWGFIKERRRILGLSLADNYVYWWIYIPARKLYRPRAREENCSIAILRRLVAWHLFIASASQLPRIAFSHGKRPFYALGLHMSRRSLFSLEQIPFKRELSILVNSPTLQISLTQAFQGHFPHLSNKRKLERCFQSLVSLHK